MIISEFLNKLFKPKCRHLRVRESMACDAWCIGCGKNLGFIKHWRLACHFLLETTPLTTLPPRSANDERNGLPTPG